jgi:lysophospholipase L1-like esterase
MAVKPLIAASLLLTAQSLLSQSSPAQTPAKPFYLHDNDTVLFYGDSITEARQYTEQIQTYVATRFPKLHIHFFAAGYGGDRVTGGGAGPIDLRLSRDVFPMKPTVITIMLGMNDGGYNVLTPAIESTYSQGYEHILDSIEKNLPGTRVTLFGASPYDEVTRPPTFPGGYNPTLVHFAQLNSELAAKHHDTFIDFNAPFNASLQRGLAINPLATELLIPDRVHPEATAHWFMAAAALKGWNAPSLVASTNIDARTQKVADASNTHISELTGSPTQLTWTELDDALPLPIDDTTAANHFLHQISDIIKDLDQEPLIVQNLAPGTYQLTIDTSVVGTFSAEDLAKGINLADFNTPMRAQANPVGWGIRDRNTAHFLRLRMQNNERNFNEPAEPGITNLLTFESQLEKHIYDLAQPKPHTFKIAPAPVAASDVK